MAHLRRDTTAPKMGHPDFWGCAVGLEGGEDGFAGGGFAVLGCAGRGPYAVVFGEVVEERGHNVAAERAKTRWGGEGVFVERVAGCGLLVAGCWLPVVCCRLMVFCCGLMVVRRDV